MLNHRYACLENEWSQLNGLVNYNHHVWDDAMRAEFDKTYWLEIDQVVKNYLEGLSELTIILQEIEQNIP
jgi:hypothetical protein